MEGATSSTAGGPDEMIIMENNAGENDKNNHCEGNSTIPSNSMPTAELEHIIGNAEPSKDIYDNNLDSIINTQCFNGQSSIDDDPENRKRLNTDADGSPSDSDLLSNSIKRSKIELFTKDTGPQWYNVKGNLVTPSIITKNLPKLFESLPVFGKPDDGEDLEAFQNKKLRTFVGADIGDDEFDEVARYCSPNKLKTGKELIIRSSNQSQGMVPMTEIPEIDISEGKLCILKKCRMRMEKDIVNNYSTKLKYRGVKLLPLNQDEDNLVEPSKSDELLEPGKDLIFRVRIYRPFSYHMPKDRCTRSRHSVFSCDVVLAGRQPLSALRDRIVCHNDVDMRVDVSENPDVQPLTSSKEAFPSGFLFINNVFYVDLREGCKDHSAIIREWAAKRGLGHFPMRDMCSVNVGDIVVKLGYPEVYVHQGSCEHVLTFSEVRLAGAADPLRRAAYPRHSAASQHQTVYCTTCAEFGAKWVVVGCARVPFDPAFFCDACFKQYLYIDGQKIGTFKAYSYRGNEINTLKPV